MFSGFFALGIALLSRVNSYRDLTHILFGNILGVTATDLWIIAGVTALVLVTVALFYKELIVTSFDPGHAVAIGLSPGLVRYGFLILLALAIVAGIQAVGVVMVVSLLVTPAAAANLLTRRLPQMIMLTILFSVAGAFVGLYASYYGDVASGPAIVLTLTGFSLDSLLIRPKSRLDCTRSPIKRPDETFLDPDADVLRAGCLSPCCHL